jgi:VCBS repeat-containing protein
MANEIATWYRFALQQVAAESMLDRTDISLAQILFEGNTDTRRAPEPSGYTRMPEALAAQFTGAGNQIIAHRANDATGFSGTLLRWTNEQGGTEYTLSVRSTEYKPFERGGDRARDFFGADGEILRSGFAFGELAALEDFYEREVLPLTGAARIHVTGYSLGGHLATVFTEMHAEAVKAAYVFNGAGRGEVLGPGGTSPERMAAMIGQFRAALTSEPNADVLDGLPPATRSAFLPYYQSALNAHLADPGWNPFAPTDVSAYGDPRYRWARIVTSTLGSFPTRSVIPPRAGLGTPGDALISSIYGNALNHDSTLVANSQVHPSTRNAVFIEGQPFLEGVYPIQERSDFGNTHAITLLVDSLALQREFGRLDPGLSREQIELIIQASSAQRTKHRAFLGDPEAAEGDSLERALIALRRALDASAPDELPVSRVPGGFGNIANRQAYYEELARLPQQGGYRIEVLAGRPAAQIAALAGRSDDTGRAVRYALRQLEPFAVVGGDYSAGRFPNGELEFQEATSDRGMSARWIEARARFLEALNRYNIANGGLSQAQIGAYFEDRQLGIRIGSPTAAGALYLFAADAGGTPLDGLAGGDFLFGGAGPDAIAGNGGRDYLEGGEGGDVLAGGGDADWLVGGPGDDQLEGGRGNDRLEGGSGFDTYVYNGGDGRDTIRDSDGSGQIIYKGRVLAGGTRTGQNTYADNAGTRYELVASSAGTQTLVIDGALSVENFVSGNFGIALQGDPVDPPAPPAITPTRIYTQLPEEFGTAVPYPADRPPDGTTNEARLRHHFVNIYGSDANDAFAYANHPFGFPGFYGRTGDDTITSAGAVGNATADGGAGNDLIDASLSSLLVQPLVQSMTLAGGSGDDFILGGEASETIFGDNYRFSDRFGGSPGIAGTPGAYLIDDFIFNLKDAYPNVLGNADAAQLETLASAGAYYYEHGPFGSALPASLFTDEGVDVAIQYLQLEGWLFPGGLPDVLDYVLGSDPSFDDYIDAGGGDDIVNGGSGSDTIFGGTGNDVINGDAGVDVAALGVLAARFGAPGDDLIDGGEGDDRILDLLGGNDTLIGGAGNDTIRSAEQSWAREPGRQAFNYIEGGEGNDVIVATNETMEGFDVVLGGAGDDSISAASVGGGIIHGGDGNDTIRATNLVLVPPSEIRIGEGYFFVDGGPGNDTYQVVNGSIRDDSGDDTLIVTLGSKADADAKFYLAASGAPSVPPAPPPGPLPPSAPPPLPVDLDSRGFFPFLDPLTATQLVYRSGNDLVISASPQLAGQSAFDTATIVDWFAGPAAPIEHVLVRSGAAEIGPGELETWGSYQAGTEAAEVFVGGDHTDRVLGKGGADVIATGEGDDLIAGGTGDDVLDGGPGNDVYFYLPGDGNDLITDASGFDRLVFGPGIDPSGVSVTLGASRIYLAVGANTLELVRAEGAEEADLPVDRLEFANGTTLALADLAVVAAAVNGTAEGETLAGNGAANTIQGGPGDDVLLGGPGSDLYLFSLGDGVDRILDLPAAGEINVVQFGPGISPDMLSLGVGSLAIRVGAGGDAIHLDGVDTNDIFGAHDVELFLFSDGTQLTYAELLERGLDIDGTPSDDVIHGSDTADRIRGGAGDDLLLDGPGSDIYFYARGDGADAIVELEPAPGDIDTLIFAPDVSAADVSVARDGDDIVIELEGPTDSVRLHGAFAYDVIERIEFGDGAVWTASMLRERVAPPPNHAPVTQDDAASVEEDGALIASGNVLANDTDMDAGTVLAVAAPGSFSGAYGSLALEADGSFVYTLDNASLAVQGLRAGETVTDTFSYSATDGVATSSGNLVVTVSGANDAPVLVAPLADRLGREGEALSFALPAGSFADVDAGDVLAYSAVTPAWLAFEPATLMFSGTPGFADSGAYEIHVTAADPAGAAAADAFTLTIAEVCNDGELFAGGNHDDVLVGGPCDDIVLGFNGKDELHGAGGDDILRGGNGSDALFGGAGDDLLCGGNAPDRLEGNAGTNVFIGGHGPDTLLVTGTNDVIAWNRGDGPDEASLAPSDGWNHLTLSFGGGVRSRDVEFKRNGSSLVVHAHGKALTISNWYALAEAERPRLAVQIIGEEVRRYEVSGAVNPLADRKRASDAWRDGGVLAVDPATGDPQVIGGGIAWSYARTGSCEALPDQELLGWLGSEGFGEPQTVGLGAGEDEDDHDDGDKDDGRAEPSGDGRRDFDSHGRDRHDHGERGDDGRRRREDEEDEHRSKRVAAAIAERIDREHEYDFATLAAYLQRKRGGDYSAMMPQEIARRWRAVETGVAALSHAEDEGGGGHDSRGLEHAWMDEHDGGAGWGHGGSTGRRHAFGGMEAFGGLSEGFRRLG